MSARPIVVGKILAGKILAAAGTLLVGLVLAAGDAPSGGLRIAFLLTAPAMVVALLLRSLDPLARIVLALAAAIVVNALVAEGMVATNTWSISNGVAAVGVISAALCGTIRARVAAQVGPGGTPRRQVAQGQRERGVGAS